MSAAMVDYFVVSGSQNTDSQSAKIAGVIAHRLAQQGASSVKSLDLAASPLPLLGSNASENEQEGLDRVASDTRDANAYVFVTPEWHGMAPAALKNYFLHFSRGQLAHKPALIVAVSASAGGAYPIGELRSSCYKNSRVCFLPENLIIRQVSSVFNQGSENHAESQDYLSKRMDFCLDMLKAYAMGMQEIRKNLPDTAPYPNGM